MTVSITSLLCFWNMGKVVPAERKQSSKTTKNCMGKKNNIAEKEPTSKKLLENTIQIYFKCII